MPGNIELEIALRVRFKVNTMYKPSYNERAISSNFTFQGRQWRLYYYYENEEHRLCLEKVSQEHHVSFDISTQVEIGDGRGGIIAEGLWWKIHWIKTMKLERIWKKHKSQVVQEYPEFGQNNNHELRFVVQMIKEYVHAEPHSVATQSKYILPEGMELSCMTSLCEDFAQLMIQGSDPDVEFKCEDQSFKAHGLVVCARSSVIARMLKSEMVEGRTRIVKIPNMTPDVFQHFLRYMYSGKLPELTIEVALPLYESGDQYAVLGLARRCSKYLVEHISIQNACDLLVVAYAHSDEDFVEKVIEYMLETKVPLTSDRWSNFSVEHPNLAMKVLKRGWEVFLK